MKKTVKWILIVLVVAFLAAQFFNPKKNYQPLTENHLFVVAQVPDRIQETLKNACLDCHSDQTNYQWYHRIAPVSFFINNHIVEGKNELNMSKWGQLTALEKISLLNKISEEINGGNMPLLSYTAIHRKARLSQEQKDDISAWTETYGMEIFKSN